MKLREEEVKKFTANPVDELDSADEADELAEKRASELAPTKKVTIQAPGDEDLDGFTEVGKGGKVVEDINVDVFEKLELVAEARGKKVSSTLILEYR
jgi:translation initiation factor 3 subunit C